MRRTRILSSIAICLIILFASSSVVAAQEETPEPDYTPYMEGLNEQQEKIFILVVSYTEKYFERQLSEQELEQAKSGVLAVKEEDIEQSIRMWQTLNQIPIDQPIILSEKQQVLFDLELLATEQKKGLRLNEFNRRKLKAAVLSLPDQELTKALNKYDVHSSCDGNTLNLKKTFFDCTPAVVNQGAYELGQLPSNIVKGAFGDAAIAFADDSDQIFMSVLSFWININTSELVNDNAIEAVQNDLHYMTGFVAVLGLIAAAVRLAFDRTGEESKHIFSTLVKFVVVNTAGIVLLVASIATTDQLSKQIIASAVDGDRVNVVSEQLGSALLFIFGLLGIIVGLLQLSLLVISSAMAVVLAGIWPLAAAGSLVPGGNQFFSKVTAWLVAFILYKPAAAICYAAAFRLSNTSGGSPEDDVVAFIMSMVLLVAAIWALPALIRLVMPVASSFNMGASLGGVMAGGAALATGAVAIKGGRASSKLAKQKMRASRSEGPSGSRN